MLRVRLFAASGTIHATYMLNGLNIIRNRELVDTEIAAGHCVPIFVTAPVAQS